MSSQIVSDEIWGKVNLNTKGKERKVSLARIRESFVSMHNEAFFHEQQKYVTNLFVAYRLKGRFNNLQRGLRTRLIPVLVAITIRMKILSSGKHFAKLFVCIFSMSVKSLFLEQFWRYRCECTNRLASLDIPVRDEVGEDPEPIMSNRKRKRVRFFVRTITHLFRVTLI